MGAMQEGMDRPRLARAIVVVPLLAALLALTGCSYVVQGLPSALEPPVDDAPAGEVTIVGADPDDPIDRLARNALADLETYWGEQFPDVFGRPFPPLEGGYFSVDPDNVDPSQYPRGVGCGAAAREVENNAFYCLSPRAPNSDAITYDRAFLGELADEFGRFIPALVMAHEFGHAVQGRVGSPETSIATETQADCLAGAWSAWVAQGNAEHSQLREPELDEVLEGYLQLRDPVGTAPGAEQAHGSYFDRVSAFQEGFDDGPTACRDNYGPSRVFTQGEFSDADLLTGGDARYPELIDIINSTLPTVWTQALGEDFAAPTIEPFRGNAPDCAADRDLELVYCGDEQLVGFDEADLAPEVYEIGDFALATAVSIPYSMSVRDQLGLSTDDGEAVRSALCLTGSYARAVFEGEAGRVTISPGDIDESVQFLLGYGKDPNVIPDVDLTGFQQVDLFRNGFVRGPEACDLGG